ncbi:MAG TPA: lasso peptide biosynthesis B2 protein [Pyrinomonadaceae bacterium]|jgi:hypothetical protein
MLDRARQISVRLSQVVLRAGRLMLRNPSEAIMLARMGVWVVLVSFGARTLTLPHLLKLTSPRLRREPSLGLEESEAALARSIDSLLAVNLFVFKPVCWKRAIVLQRFLALRGIRTRIVFGVKRTDEQLLAGHAWLEVGNQPLLETEPPGYTITYAFPDRA